VPDSVFEVTKKASRIVGRHEPFEITGELCSVAYRAAPVLRDTLALMDPEDSDFGPVFEKLGRVQRAWPAPSWSWDARMMMLASSFGRELEKPARASVAEALTYA
jgi:hypothetical protein